MSSPRWHWSPYSGIQCLQQYETHNIPCHGLQTKCLHFPQCSAARPLHCHSSSCSRMIFENPIGSWNSPGTERGGLPYLIKTLFHFRLHPCSSFEVSSRVLHFVQLKVPGRLLYYHVSGISNTLSRCLVQFVALCVCSLSVELLSIEFSQAIAS